MLLMLLGVIDLLAGAVLALHPALDAAGSASVVMITAFVVGKGMYSIVAAFAAGFYFDIMGYVDILGALCLLLLYFGVAANLFIYIGLAVIIKGVYSFAMGLVEVQS